MKSQTKSPEEHTDSVRHSRREVTFGHSVLTRGIGVSISWWLALASFLGFIIPNSRYVPDSSISDSKKLSWSTYKAKAMVFFFNSLSLLPPMVHASLVETLFALGGFRFDYVEEILSLLNDEKLSLASLDAEPVHLKNGLNTRQKLFRRFFRSLFGWWFVPSGDEFVLSPYGFAYLAAEHQKPCYQLYNIPISTAPLSRREKARLQDAKEVEDQLYPPYLEADDTLYDEIITNVTKATQASSAAPLSVLLSLTKTCFTGFFIMLYHYTLPIRITQHALLSTHRRLDFGSAY